MARSHIIVEAEGDKFTFEAIIRHIKLQDKLSVNAIPSILTDIEWSLISKEKDYPRSLIKGLKDLISDITSNKYDKIAIIRDLDLDSKQDMLTVVNKALSEAYAHYNIKEIDDVNKLVPFTFSQYDTEEPVTVQFACYFVHQVNDKGMAKGEMEDILKAIKAKPSPIADCVDKHLPECLNINNEDELREKDLVKLWINNYQRYDTLSRKILKNHSQQATTKYIMENRPEIYDFDKDLPEFNELKAFLKMMSE